MRKTLNDRSLLSLPHGYTWDASMPSFGVYKGTRTTTFIVLKGSGRRHKIGRYPRLSLKDARRRAHAILSLNHDTPTTDTQTALGEYAEALNVDAKTKFEYLRLLALLKLKSTLSDISAAHILSDISTLTRSEARHAWFAASAFFSWCMERHYLSAHPLRGLRCPHKHHTRHHTPSDDNIRKIWLATPDDTYGQIVRLLIATAQRRAMIAELDEVWIKADRISFPASICKNSTNHDLPLTPFLSNLLKTYDFPGKHSAWSKPKKALDKAAGVTGYTLHDFRRYFATVSAEKLGTEPQVIEAVLHHLTGTISPLGRIYNRARYFEPMRVALQRYHEHLEHLISPQSSP
jgi:integrase